ncbi:hypothetical protein L798_05496 [Zootermopsis nevadensis]|uniref:Uncharacterized protein n=1 Tax=Zootermopsis nevadensis TaxID=136037 RepID=A0A067QS94_ZOONE|nr:hypothetical protein L798_05496 [Zootermopsis nevadensis]
MTDEGSDDTEESCHSDSGTDNTSACERSSGGHWKEKELIMPWNVQTSPQHTREGNSSLISELDTQEGARWMANRGTNYTI